MNRLNIDGDYLIIAPKGELEYGYHHSLTERAFLVDNLANFIKRYPDIKPHHITVYELREVNEHATEQAVQAELLPVCNCTLHPQENINHKADCPANPQSA